MKNRMPEPSLSCDPFFFLPFSFFFLLLFFLFLFFFSFFFLFFSLVWHVQFDYAVL